MSSTCKRSAATKQPPKKNMKSPSPVTSISSLPYDLLLKCLACVSRLYYPTLSLVSKQVRSIVASRELYETRLRLDRTESCLYLCLRFPSDPNTHWFTLCQKPNRTLTKNSTGNLLIQILSPHINPEKYSSTIAVGSKIYKISADLPYSSRVSVLDCRYHTWHQAPSMQVDWTFSSTASLVDGKIYVVGGCKDNNSLNWVQVFDPKTQSWSNVTSPCVKIYWGGKFKSLGLEGKFYLFGNDNKFVAYNPKESRWSPIGVDSDMAIALHFGHSVIDNVLFMFMPYDGMFKWYDCKVSSWKDLNGVEGLPDFSNCVYIKMVDLGGKMAVLWDEFVHFDSKNMIWCAVIALERRDGGEIWGKAEWFDVVLTVDGSCCLFYADALSTII